MTGVGVGASPVFRSSASSSSSAGGTSAGGGGSAKGTKLSVERSLLAEIVSVAAAPFFGGCCAVYCKHWRQSRHCTHSFLRSMPFISNASPPPSASPPTPRIFQPQARTFALLSVPLR